VGKKVVSIPRDAIHTFEPDLPFISPPYLIIITTLLLIQLLYNI
jgi:hypothetical protein